MALAAETIYNISRELSNSELQRLVALLQRDLEPVAPKTSNPDVWTLEECIEIIQAQLYSNKRSKKSCLKIV